MDRHRPGKPTHNAKQSREKRRTRTFKITPKLTAMLNALLKEKDGPSEAQKLIETGFEYICTHDNIMLFRKRK
ncbi:MAG: hypothetical protein ACUVQL_01630 [Candidatus Bathycorpusculaceae bacterium]